VYQITAEKYDSYEVYLIAQITILTVHNADSIIQGIITYRSGRYLFTVQQVDKGRKRKKI